MKIASCSEKLRKLYTTKFFPSPDMVAEVHWATKTETFHMKNDEKFLDKEEGVDIVPAWSLPLLISAIPKSIIECDEEDNDYEIEYNLQIIPGDAGAFSYIRYITIDGKQIENETKSLHLVDAIVEMISILGKEGWYDEP